MTRAWIRTQDVDEGRIHIQYSFWEVPEWDTDMRHGWDMDIEYYRLGFTKELKDGI